MRELIHLFLLTHSAFSVGGKPKVALLDDLIMGGAWNCCMDKCKRGMKSPFIGANAISGHCVKLYHSVNMLNAYKTVNNYNNCSKAELELPNMPTQIDARSKTGQARFKLEA